ncbi:MAG TPA: hypothetical protein PKU91_10780, partial [Phycisphaerales bacterium]|nr:hypothetical protein [Phycisphaerales bacterium]
ASIADPRAEYEQLRASRQAGTLAGDDQSKLSWLEQLNLIGRLKPEYTTTADARAQLEELRNIWSTSRASAPSELSWYDIPAQWVIMAVGVGFGLYLFSLLVVVRRTRYGWEPDHQRLHLPGGATLVPADVEVFDKRKWDKFLIYLKIRPSHERLGGREICLDLLRYTPLEEWVLTMERTAFPESVEMDSATPPALTPEAPPQASPEAPPEAPPKANPETNPGVPQEANPEARP